MGDRREIERNRLNYAACLFEVIAPSTATVLRSDGVGVEEFFLLPLMEKREKK